MPMLLFWKATLYGAWISDVNIEEQRDKLIIGFKANDCFSSEMEEAIQNGVPLVLTFNVEVFQPKKLWPDKCLAASSLMHMIEYDTLKDEFVVLLAGKDSKLRFQSFNEAKQTVATVDNLQVDMGKNLKTKKNYYVRYFLKIDTTANGAKLPFYLEHIFTFLKWGQTKLQWFPNP